MPERWSTESTSRLVTDRWLSLRADTCRTGAGVEVSPYYVFEYPDWVTVLALTREREVLVVSQYRHAAGIVSDEFIGGSVSHGGETPLRAAMRELQEETGFGGGFWSLTGSPWANAATHTNRNHCYLAVDVVPHADALQDPREVVQCRRLPFADFVRALQSGALDLPALHLAALYLAVRFAYQQGTELPPAAREYLQQCLVCRIE